MSNASIDSLRVLHVIPSVTLRDGGPSIAVRALAAALCKRGMTVTVATTDSDRDQRLDVVRGKPVDVKGVTYLYFALGRPERWRYSRDLAAWLAGSVGRFDVVHVHALFSYPTIPACRYSLRSGVPYVLRPLGMLDPWCMAQRRFRKALYYQLFERRHLERAAMIHATSELEGRYLAELGFGDTVRVIPLATDLPATATSRVRIPDAKVRILFLSRLDPIKGLDLLLHAIASLPLGDVHLDVVGGGDRRYERTLREIVREAGLETTVSFYGHTEGVLKARFFECADIFVLPSHHENFGIAVVEAMAHGLPVIVSDQVGLSIEIASAKAGLVVPLKIPAIADAIRTLVSDPQLRQRMAMAGRSLAAKFSWSSTAELLEQEYRRIANH